MKKTLALLFLLQIVMGQLLNAQTPGGDFMRNTGKIYVVVAVIVAVFIGIVLFLIYLDRRLTNLEDQINNHD